jgi:hypothetical protein
MLANFGLPSSLGTPRLPTRLNFGLATFTKLKKKNTWVNRKKVLHSVIEKKTRQEVKQNSPIL